MTGVGWGGRGHFRWVDEPAPEALRAEGMVGDARRSLVGRQILCVDEPVGVGAADEGLGGGWCGRAAYRWEEAWACAAEMGDDVVDDGVVGDEAHDAEFSGTGGTGQGLDLQHPAQQFCPREPACTGGRRVVAWGLVGCGVRVGGQPLASCAALLSTKTFESCACANATIMEIRTFLSWTPARLDHHPRGHTACTAQLGSP